MLTSAACRTVSIGNTVISGNAGGDVKSGGPNGSNDNDSPIVSLGYNLIGALPLGHPLHQQQH